MNNKLRYQDLENRNVEFQKQIEFLNFNSTFKSEEKEKSADELIVANLEHVISTLKLVFQNDEKKKRSAELIISKIKFAYQSKEREKLEEELSIANFVIAIQLELIAAKKTEIQLKEVNAAKDKVYSIIAHDLRSPFNSILGFSNMLINNTKQKDYSKTEEYLEYIYSSAQDTLVLLDNLLNWEKSQTGHINFNPQKIILSAVIQDVIRQFMSNVISKNISLNYIQSGNILAYADEDMLRTVLRNLISNAIKFTKAGGNINVLLNLKQDHIEISVSDNGVGMNEETSKKLFTESINITTNGTANEKGSGLGLVLCKEFVEKHSGNIWVESEEGRGSDFKFTLPVNVNTLYKPKKQTKEYSFLETIE